MKSKQQNREQSPLASPFEVAQLATSLAILQGRAEPDIEGALALLSKAEAEIRFSSEVLEIAQLFFTGYDEKCFRSFPGADRISVPKGDTWNIKQIIGAVIGRTDTTRINTVIKKMRLAKQLTEQEEIQIYQDPMNFWLMAEKIAPFVSRLKSYYPDSSHSIPKKRAKKSRKSHRQKHDGSGIFSPTGPES